MKQTTGWLPSFFILFLLSGVSIASTFQVTNLNDSGANSLRQAIINANGSAGADTINFSVTGTITLTSGELAITDDLVITGPGAASLTVSGNNASRVFSINSGATVTISGLTIAEGLATDQGGGIFNNGNLNLSNCVVSGNNCNVIGAECDGGGIYHATGSLTITGSTISANLAAGGGYFSYGGGIFISGGTVNITASTISGNTVSAAFPNNGGGIFIQGGTLNITDSTLSGNSAPSGGGGGGILNVGGTINATNSTFSGNSCANFGGAIYNVLGTLTLSNSTIAGNSAFSASGGNIANSDVMVAKNSIIGNNTGGGDCLNQGTITDSGSNLDTDGTCGFTSVSSAQLNLGPLAGNGGPTQTRALLPGSVAIDAVTDCTDASSTAVNADQRGITRPQGVACDIGAYEALIAAAQTVAVDPQGRFFLYAGPSTGCPTDLLFYRRLDATGNPSGSVVPLISCGLLPGSLLGIDILNGSGNDSWISFAGTTAGDGKYLMKIDSLGNIRGSARQVVPAAIYGSMVGATAIAQNGCCRLGLYSAGASGSILRSLIDSASLGLLKTKTTAATTSDALSLQVTQRKQTPAFLALTHPGETFRAYELSKGLPDGTTWRLSPRTDSGHEFGAVSADGLAALSNESNTPIDNLYLQMLGSTGRPINNPLIVAVDDISAADISNPLPSSLRYVVFATDDGRLVLQRVNAVSGAIVGSPIALN